MPRNCGRMRGNGEATPYRSSASVAGASTLGAEIGRSEARANCGLGRHFVVTTRSPHNSFPAEVGRLDLAVIAIGLPQVIPSLVEGTVEDAVAGPLDLGPRLGSPPPHYYVIGDVGHARSREEGTQLLFLSDRN